MKLCTNKIRRIDAFKQQKRKKRQQKRRNKNKKHTLSATWWFFECASIGLWRFPCARWKFDGNVCVCVCARLSLKWVCVSVSAMVVIPCLCACRQYYCRLNVYVYILFKHFQMTFWPSSKVWRIYVRNESKMDMIYRCEPQWWCRCKWSSRARDISHKLVCTHIQMLHSH